MNVCALEHDAVVRLVGQQEDPPVVARRRRFEQRGELGEQRRPVDPPRRVVRRVHDDGARPRRDRRLDRLEVQIEGTLAIRVHPHRRRARGDDQRLVEEPRRRDEDHLVADVHDRPQRDGQPGEVAVRHVDVVCAEREPEPVRQTGRDRGRGLRQILRVRVVILARRLGPADEGVDVGLRGAFVRVAEHEVARLGAAQRLPERFVGAERREVPERRDHGFHLLRERAHLPLLATAVAERFVAEEPAEAVPAEDLQEALDLALVRFEGGELQRRAPPPRRRSRSPARLAG